MCADAGMGSIDEERVFAGRLASKCVQIYIQLHMWGMHPHPVLPMACHSLFFSPGSHCFLERGWPAVVFLRVMADPFSWDFLTPPRPCFVRLLSLMVDFL